ncbi:putative Phytocyanin domain, cupredoxin [Helianthus annuus]|nr:putative Phytocyanin domain, cupredoxin [Helianthus annuus]KAJ0746526.1 putative Phytocyanin domain, cupredoxin [Helianthus annuus]KAJ0749600.1 putative Phytocyanin domain, cupredoxin [Helianthus annuus]
MQQEAIKMANKNLCIFILIATIVTQATWVRAVEYTVGECKGWNEGVDFQAWADGKEYVQGDRLVFNYEYGKHNVVLLPDQASLDNCNLEKPLISLAHCGRNVVNLRTPGRVFVSSAVGEDCKKGLKFWVDVKPCPAVLQGAHYIT